MVVLAAHSERSEWSGDWMGGAPRLGDGSRSGDAPIRVCLTRGLALATPVVCPGPMVGGAH